MDVDEQQQQPAEFVFYGRGTHGRVVLTNPAPVNSAPLQAQSMNAPRAIRPIDILAPPKLVPQPTIKFFTVQPGPRAAVAPPHPNATDLWHRDRIAAYMPHHLPIGRAAPVSIAFAAAAGPCTEGVALTELALSRGMWEPRIRVERYIPKALRGAAAGALVLGWPGYPETRAGLALKDVTGRHVTRAALGKEVARLLKRYMEMHGGEFVGPTGMPGIKHEQLRLLEVWSRDGVNFNFRLAVVPARVPEQSTGV